jgi:transcriptional regulator with XRE-family HTH domain
LRQLAKTAGVSNPYLSQVERGLKKPSAEILAQIAKGLRISAETLYVRAGLLDERLSGDVVAAVLADTSIGDRHKRVLLDVYESFRAEHAAELTDPSMRKAAASRTAATKTTKKTTTKTTTKKTPTKKTAAATKPAATKTTTKKSPTPRRSAR